MPWGYIQTENIRGEGCCMAMTAHWAKMVLSSNDGINSFRILRNQLYTQRMYENLPGTVIENDTWLINQYGLNIAQVFSRTTINSMASLLDGTRGIYLVGINGGENGHAMGACHDGNVWVFFDPNSSQAVFSSRINFEAYVRRLFGENYSDLQERWETYRLELTP